MHFELSERLETDCPIEGVMDRAWQVFGLVSESVEPISGSSFRAKGIEATFGSINRSDDTIVEVRPADGGWLIAARVHYRPSIMFWVFIILSLFLYVSWIFSVVFYFIHKETVRRAVANCLNQLTNELRRSSTASAANAGAGDRMSLVERLTKLAELKDRGLLTDMEFAEQKARVLAGY